MRNIDIDLDRFNSLYSLSCVESYMLYILDANQYHFQHLYAQSYAGIAEILQYFLWDKKVYAYYDGVPRLQRTAIAHGVLAMQTVQCSDICTDPDYDFFMLKLHPEYIKKTYGAAAWRDDHYVLLTGYDDRHRTYINDSPRDYRTLTCGELEQAYAGSMIKLKLLGDLSDRSADLLLEDFLTRIRDSLNTDVIIPIEDGIAARDALAVLRILRRRMYVYCTQYISCDFMKAYLRKLDKCFSAIEYMRLRRSMDFSKLAEMFQMVQHQDMEILDIIKRKMGEQYGQNI